MSLTQSLWPTLLVSIDFWSVKISLYLFSSLSYSHILMLLSYEALANLSLLEICIVFSSFDKKSYDENGFHTI